MSDLKDIGKLGCVGAIVLGVLFAGVCLTLIAARHIYVQQQTPWVLRQNAELKEDGGRQKYWPFPQHPKKETLQPFRPGVLVSYSEVTPSGAKVDWDDPNCPYVFHYREEWLDKDGEVVRVNWDGEFRPGCSMDPFPKDRIIRITYSQIAGPPAYLRVDTKAVSEKYGYKMTVTK
jgi:hypothetical protein